MAAVRVRAAAAKQSKEVTNATALIWQVLMVAARRCRLNAPELLAALPDGRFRPA